MGDILQNKIKDADFLDRDITSIEGNTVAGQADWLKQRFDSSVKQVVAPRLNALIDDLAATTAAGQIGAAPLLPGGTATVGGQLAYLKNELNGIALSQIPDGTVTDEKLSGAPGQVKARLGAVEQEKAPLASPAFTGEPTAPTAALDDSSEKLANTACVQGKLDSLRSDVYALGTKQNVQTGSVDFNTLTSHGTYTWYSNSHIRTCPNAPEATDTRAGTLTVDYILGQNALNYIVQTFRDYVGSEWMRYSSDSGSTWNPWSKNTYAVTSYYDSDGNVHDANTTVQPLILTSVNTPGGYMYVHTYFEGVKSSSGNRAQIAMPYNSSGSMWHRHYYDGAWSSWRKNLNAGHIESGMFTPQLYNRSTGIVPSYTYANQKGLYWKFDNLVYISIYINGVKNLPSTASAGLTGLPYACDDSIHYSMTLSHYYDLFASHADGDPVTAYVSNGKNHIAFAHTRGGNSAVFSQSAQNGMLMLSGCYVAK